MIWIIWNDARHNIRESLEIVDQSQTPRYILRFEHLALRPRLHTKRFSLYRPHRTSHTGNLHWEFRQIQLGSTQLLSHQIQPLTRGKAQSQHNINLLLEGYQQTQSPLHLEGWHLAKQISTSHKRDKAQSHNFHNHLFTKKDTNTTSTITSH